MLDISDIVARRNGQFTEQVRDNVSLKLNFNTYTLPEPGHT